MHFIHNLDTGKLNIFTGGKSAWQALAADKRNEIKRYCLFSRTQECWVSKAQADHAHYLKRILAELGFEDRGAIGEAPSFVEKIEAKQERAEARAERYEDRAGAATEQSEQLYNRAHEMADVIPFGQPILVGHHSEKRDRNYRERIHNTFVRAFESHDKAKHYAGRAAAARETADGSKYSDPAYLGNRIKERQAEIRLLERRLQGKYTEHSTPQPISDEYRERLETMLAKEREELEFFEHCLATCGKKTFNRETLKGTKEVLLRGRWEPIVRLNPTTVAVPNICFPTEESQRKYALKYAYGEVQDAR